ncbi:MAG: hypothetical protein ACK4N5_18765 [Myxococcales bacterium]
MRSAPVALLLFALSCSGNGSGGPAGGIRVLFDAGHRQVAGNAFWIVDEQAPDPAPSDPTSESDWSGAISAWAFDLHATGRYRIRQLPEGEALSFGDGGPFDLKDVQVFVSVEPEKPFSAAEQQALLAFAQHGGGIFLVANHRGAKRCDGCVEAWQVVNGFLEEGAQGAYGLKVDGNDIGRSGLTGTLTGAPVAAFLREGPFGKGERLVYHSGSSVSVTGGNPGAAVLVQSKEGGMLASSELPSGGRLMLLGDSSPPDDGTCECRAKIFDGWAEADHRVLLLNATAWLARDDRQ